MTTPSGVSITINGGIRPSTSQNVYVMVKARGAWEMRLENNAAPSGAWQDYDPQVLHALPSGYGTHWVVAEVRDDGGNAADLVSGVMDYWYGPYGITFGQNVDTAMYYSVKGILESAGYVDASGNLDGVSFQLGEVESHLLYEYPEDTLATGTYDLSVDLPAIILSNTTRTDDPGALGGASWEARYYQIEIFAETNQEAKELSEVICDKIKAPLNVYDYNLGFPEGNPSFPLPNQLIGAFPIRNLKSGKVLLPSYGSLTEHRRRINLEVHNMRKSY